MSWTPQRHQDARAALNEDNSQWGGEYGSDALGEIARLNDVVDELRSLVGLLTRERDEWESNADQLTSELDHAHCLIRENSDRLQEPQHVTAEIVERAARAFYERLTPGLSSSLRTNWDRLADASPDVADNYRRHMRAALHAALGTQDGT